MATISQIKKIERLVKESSEAFRVYSRLEEVRYKNSKETKLYNSSIDLYAKKDEELNRYIISIGLTEDEFYSIESLRYFLDGVLFEDYINNY